MSQHQRVPLICSSRPRPNDLLIRLIETSYFKQPNPSQQMAFHYGRPLPLPKDGAKSLGRSRATASTAMARVTHLRPALPPSPALVTVSTPSWADLVIAVKLTAVGSAACSHTAVPPTLAAKTHAHRLRRITTKTRRVATATTAVTITGTPTLVSLVTVARNNKVMLEALKAVAKRSLR